MNYSTLKKTVALSAVCLMAFGAAKAQTTDTTKMMSSDMASAKTFGGLSQYNHLSIGLNVGVANPDVNFMNNAVAHSQPQLGYGASLRDQLSHFFGLALDYNGGKVQGNDVASEYVNGVKTPGDYPKYTGDAFQTSFNQVTLNGIIDFGSVSFLHRQNAVDFYGSAGAGLVFYHPKFNRPGQGGDAPYQVDYDKTVKELDAPVGVGVKFKLSDALALNVGYTVNFINGVNFAGFHTGNNYDHYSYSYAGLEYTFGPSSKKNIDWVNPIAMMYDELYDAALRQEVKALEGRVGNVETAVADLKKDSDGDGVSDQFDKCPGTPAGTPVDGSGCPLPKIDTAAFCKFCQGKDTVAATGNVQFDFDSYVLRTSSYPLLDKKSADIKASGATVTLAGYASSEGTLAHNMQLSKDRANAVKNYLINSGVEAKKLKAKGYGIANPIAPNSTEAGRELNRRVEFHM
jgi:OmpA-OmpF porin, OOP family